MVSSNHPNNVPNAISLTNQEVLFREGLLFVLYALLLFYSMIIEILSYFFIICVKTETVLALFFIYRTNICSFALLLGNTPTCRM